MSDIVAMLRQFVERGPDNLETWTITRLDAKDILAEIDHLRSLAGAVSSGPALADIRKQLDTSGLA